MPQSYIFFRIPPKKAAKRLLFPEIFVYLQADIKTDLK
jgi:hypothetical protein